MNSLYIHIPYCLSRCGYCDFHSSMCVDDKDDYVEALIQELEQRKDYLPSNAIGTIYFGGGTPSLLSLAQLTHIFTHIKKLFSIEENAEITLESNPDDLSESYLKGLLEIGFNRLSVGIQSFDNDDLKLINRRHKAEDAIEAIKTAQNLGFDNISADLIFALPHQTLAKWQKNLTQLFALDVQHISCYNLSYEEGTAFYQKLMQGEFEELGDDESLMMYKELISEAKGHGFEHYETSNFAKEGLYSKHNSNYWTGASYLGIGAGAHSYNGKTRQWNASDNQEYIKSTQKGKSASEKESIDTDTAYNEYIMTGLRTMWGCDLLELKNKFGKEKLGFCLEAARPYLKSGQVVIKNDTMTISDEAIFISDQIMADLMQT